MGRKQSFLIVALALVAAVIGGAVSSQLFNCKPVFAQKKEKPQKLVVAEEFRMVDKDGNVLAVLTTAINTGEPIFIIHDKEMHHKFSVLLGPQNVTVSLSGEKGPKDILSKVGIDLVVGGPTARLNLHNATSAVDLGAYFSGDALISVFSFAGNKISVEASPSGDAKLELYDNDGNLRTVLGNTDLEVTHTGETRKRPISSLVLFDKKGKVSWSAP